MVGKKNKRSAEADLGAGSVGGSGEGNESSNDGGPLTLYSTSRIAYITKCCHSNTVNNNKCIAVRYRVCAI